MRKMLQIVLLSILLISNAYSNSAFKASFVNEKDEKVDMIGKKPQNEKKQEKKDEIIEHDPVIKDMIDSSDNTERILSKKINCLKDINGTENCPESLIQCNQLIEKDKGNSTLVKKTIYKNKFLKNGNYVCPETYVELDYHNLKEGVCKKDYSYYSYSCSSDKNEYNLSWKGPLIDTGDDCMGQCGPNGCICNSKLPPENNCMRENFGCPFDIEQKCSISVSKDSQMPKIFDGVIYSKTISSKIDKSIYLKKICSPGFKLDTDGNCSVEPIKLCPLDSKLDKNGYCYYENNKEAIIPFPTCPMDSSYNKIVNKCVSSFNCENGATKTNYGCVKDYSYYSYSCEKGYSLKEKGKDCLGTCGPSGCICNSENPKNNCSKKYSFDEPSADYKQERMIKEIKPIGTFNKNFIEKELNFESSGFEELNFIETNLEEKDTLCFSNNNKQKDCIKVENCSFEGFIKEEKIKGLKLLNKNTISSLDETQKITSSCNLNGNIGWENRINGITSIHSKDNKLIFKDAYKDRILGFIEFLPIIDENDLKDGFSFENDISFKLNTNNYTSIDFIDGYTYFISNELMDKNKCKKESIKYNLIQELIFETKILKDNLKLLSSNNYEVLNANNKQTKCILKKEGNYSFSSYKIMQKNIKAEKGKKIYSCSPLSCVNNFCQQASCQNGYEGEIHGKGDFVKEGECFSQSCDANKPYALYCGKAGSCDTTKDNIFQENDSCKQAICNKGSYNKEKNKCIETKEDLNIEKK